MRTSYFANASFRERDKPCLVSIARRAPHGFQGKRYPKLAPPSWLLTAWHRGQVDVDEYASAYISEVLQFLNPREVYEELGHDAILLCYEKPGEFCHRNIVSRWIFYATGMVVAEYGADAE